MFLMMQYIVRYCYVKYKETELRDYVLLHLFCIKLDTIKSLSFYEEKDTYNKVQKYISNINLFKLHFDKFFPDDESSRVFEC